MNKILKVFFIFIFSFSISNYTLAGYCNCNGTTISYTPEQCYNQQSSGCQWVIEDNTSSGPVSLDNPLGKGKTDIPTLLGTIIGQILGVVGSLALVMFIYGGIAWMLSAGNQEQVTKGKNILIWATIGIVIIFTAYALVKFVLTTVTS